MFSARWHDVSHILRGGLCLLFIFWQKHRAAGKSYYVKYEALEQLVPDFLHQNEQIQNRQRFKERFQTLCLSELERTITTALSSDDL